MACFIVVSARRMRFARVFVYSVCCTSRAFFHCFIGVWRCDASGLVRALVGLQPRAKIFNCVVDSSANLAVSCEARAAPKGCPACQCERRNAQRAGGFAAAHKVWSKLTGGVGAVHLSSVESAMPHLQSAT